jgi:chromosome segregation ATPase
MAKSEIEHLQDERQKLLGTIGELIKQIKEYEAEKSNTQT